MKEENKLTEQEIQKLNFNYGNAWKSNPSIYLAHLRNTEITRRCDHCGAKMTASDENDYGSLCERCYNREYYGD